MPTPTGLLGDRYRLLERLATGGMGVVWRAMDTALGRQVAIKLIRPECADDPAFRDRLRSEARAIAAIDNPHVVRIFDVGEQPDPSGGVRSYLVMELVDGIPLSDRLRGPQPLAPPVVAAIVRQAATALAAAHARGIVHRDVKPANLLLDAADHLTIVDFGIARAADGASLTATNTMIGTARYLSPEQVSGQIATAASDVYALGVVAFQCLAGRLPFDGDNDIAVALAHREQPVPDLPAGTPGDLAVLVRQMLAKAPDDRPNAADIVARAARRGEEQAPLVIPTADEPATTPLMATDVAGGTADRPRRRRLLALLAAAGTTAIAAAVVTLISTSGGGGTHRPPAAPGVADPSSSTPSTGHTAPAQTAAGTARHSADRSIATRQAAAVSHKSDRRPAKPNSTRSAATQKSKSRPKPGPKPSGPKHKQKPPPKPKPKPTSKPTPRPTPTATPTPRLTPTPTVTATPTPT